MINIPFNYQPVSVSVKTSSYDIPAGSYAYVVSNVRDGGTFTIDGTTALASEANVASDVVAVSVSPGVAAVANYVVPAEYIFEGVGVYSGSNPGNISVGGIIIGKAYLNTSSGIVPQNVIRAGGGTTVSISAEAGSNQHISGYARSLQQQESNATGGFWVPAGTTISGTGAFWNTVSLFNEIS